MTDEPAVRVLRPADVDAARALVSAAVDGTRYSQRTHEVLDAAIAGCDDEHVGLVLPEVAGEAGGRTIAAVAVIGAVAGATGAWRLHWLFAPDLAAARRMAAGAAAMARDRGARLLVCELPDDVPFVVAKDAVAVAGFIVEGSLPDFVRDGIALQLWVTRF